MTIHNDPTATPEATRAMLAAEGLADRLGRLSAAVRGLNWTTEAQAQEQRIQAAYELRHVLYDLEHWRDFPADRRCPTCQRTDAWQLVTEDLSEVHRLTAWEVPREGIAADAPPGVWDAIFGRQKAGLEGKGSEGPAHFRCGGADCHATYRLPDWVGLIFP